MATTNSELLHTQRVLVRRMQELPDSHEKISKYVDVVAKLVLNLLTYPSDSRYRSIRSANNTIHDAVFSFAEGIRMLETLGWEKTEEGAQFREDKVASGSPSWRDIETGLKMLLAVRQLCCADTPPAVRRLQTGLMVALSDRVMRGSATSASQPPDTVPPASEAQEDLFEAPYDGADEGNDAAVPTQEGEVGGGALPPPPQDQHACLSNITRAHQQILSAFQGRDVNTIIPLRDEINHFLLDPSAESERCLAALKKHQQESNCVEVSLLTLYDAAVVLGYREAEGLHGLATDDSLACAAQLLPSLGDDPELQVVVRNQLAAAKMILHDPAGALEPLKQAADICRSNSLGTLGLAVSYNLGQSLAVAGDLAGAVTELENAFAFAATTQVFPMQIRILGALTMCYAKLREGVAMFRCMEKLCSMSDSALESEINVNGPLRSPYDPLLKDTSPEAIPRALTALTRYGSFRVVALPFNYGDMTTQATLCTRIYSGLVRRGEVTNAVSDVLTAVAEGVGKTPLLLSFILLPQPTPTRCVLLKQDRSDPAS